MKKILLFIFAVIGLTTYAQTNYTADGTTGGGDWNNAATWTPSGVPTAIDNVTINGVAVIVPAGTSAVCNNLTSLGGSSVLNVREGANVTVNGDYLNARFKNSMLFTYTSNTTSNRDTGTIIVEGVSQRTTLTSAWRYRVTKRLPTNDEWYLISVGSNGTSRGEGFLKAPSTNNLENLVLNGSNQYSIALYNGANAAGSKYEYLTTSTPAANNNNFSKIGYSMKVNNTENSTLPDFRMSPLMRSTNISEDISDAGDAFNLVGNPYPAYIHANTAADATNNLLAVNSAVLEEQTIWMWNNAKTGGAGFETFNLGDAALRISPMQGFFVKAKSGGGTSQSFSYTKAMRSHTKAGNFLKTTEGRFEIILSVASNEKQTNTKLRYINGTSTAFDNGYDSSIFGGAGAGDIQLYTQLVDANATKKLAIQSLPNENYENLVIPVGVKVTEETNYTFSLEVSNLPKGYKVFLEDRLNGTFTRLDEAGSEYTVTLSEETDGRFFIHTKASVLSAESQTLSGVGVFKNASTLNVVGLPQGKASLSLYNMLGKEVFVHSFVSKSVNNINLPSLAKGVYIVKLNTERGSLSKKIILD